MGLSEIYTEEVHEHLHPWYANWEPGEPITIGDYGIMDGDIFIRQGHIKTLIPEVSLEIIQDTTKDHRKFRSDGINEIEIGAGADVDVAGVANISAGFRIEFSRNRGVFFNAAGCLTRSLHDKTGLAKIIEDLYEKGEWKKKWAVVTDTITAKATTVAVSNQKNSAITFEVTGDVNKVDLADADIGLKTASNDNVGYQVVTVEGMTPLIKLMKLQSAWWNPFDDDEFDIMKAVRPAIEGNREEQRVETIFNELI